MGGRSSLGGERSGRTSTSSVRTCGGPFVLEDGIVGGVVFAQSKVDPAVGYALSPTEVLDRVNASIGQTLAVDTGPCPK